MSPTSYRTAPPRVTAVGAIARIVQTSKNSTRAPPGLETRRRVAGPHGTAPPPSRGMLKDDHATGRTSRSSPRDSGTAAAPRSSPAPASRPRAASRPSAATAVCGASSAPKTSPRRTPSTAIRGSSGSGTTGAGSSSRRARPTRRTTSSPRWSTGVPHFTLITQNVDGLHERAGTRDVDPPARLDLGRALPPWLRGRRRSREDRRTPLPELPPRCACGDLLRPGVVWFGEALDGGVLARARRRHGVRPLHRRRHVGPRLSGRRPGPGSASARRLHGRNQPR